MIKQILKFYKLYFYKLNSYVTDFQKYLDSNLKTFYNDKKLQYYKPSFTIDKNNSQDIIDLYTYTLNISSCIMEQFLQIRVKKNKMICCDETIEFIDLEHTNLNNNYELEEEENNNNDTRLVNPGIPGPTSSTNPPSNTVHYNIPPYNEIQPA